MAFNKSTLQIAIKAVFDSMKNGDNTVFANDISNAIVSFVSTGNVTTIDGGTVTGGVFAGSGSGVLTVTPTACAQIIKRACDNMKESSTYGNDYLAEEIGRGIQQMADDGVVTTNVNGTLTPPSSSPVPYAGTASGSINCVSSTVVTALKRVFNQMWNERETEGYDGNQVLAQDMADAINTFWTSGVISTQGQANLAGSSGSGTIS